MSCLSRSQPRVTWYSPLRMVHSVDAPIVQQPGTEPSQSQTAIPVEGMLSWDFYPSPLPAEDPTRLTWMNSSPQQNKQYCPNDADDELTDTDLCRFPADGRMMDAPDRFKPLQEERDEDPDGNEIHDPHDNGKKHVEGGV